MPHGRTLRWLAAASLIGLAALCISQVSQTSDVEEIESVLPYLSALVPALQTIDTFYVEEVDIDNLLRHGTRRLVTSLDARSVILFPDEKQQQQADLGLNMMLKNGLFTVISLEPNSSSAASDIRPGDRLLAVNDSPVGQLTLQELHYRLSGKPSSQVKLLLIGSEGLKTKEVTLARQKYEPAKTSSFMTENRIMYFKVHRFAEGAAQAFKEALLAPESERLTGIVIDLRDNIGGSISEAVDMCSRFVRSGPVFVLAGNSTTRPVNRDASVLASAEGLPIVVLVNSRTVGEAEVMAACLRGHRVARLVGEKTFGCALSTDCIVTTDGTKVILATAAYQGPFGQPIHKVGLTPDIEVAAEAEVDRQFLTARDVILHWEPISDSEQPVEKAASPEEQGRTSQRSFAVPDLPIVSAGSSNGGYVSNQASCSFTESPAL